MNPALHVTGLHKAFGPTRIIQGIELTVAKGERHAVIGPNGAGKSTLFHLVTGRLRPDAGQVALHGRDITGLPAHEVFNLGLARSFQVTSLFPKLSVFENLRAAAMRTHGCGLAFWRRLDGYGPLRERAESILQQLGLERRRDVLAGNLAYAEQRALEIGVTVAGGADTRAFSAEWRRLRNKAPDLLTSRTAWTTPLKATNRLLVGPFESQRAAQDFVNKLAPKGITAFAWTSAKGQAIAKLATR